MELRKLTVFVLLFLPAFGASEEKETGTRTAGILLLAHGGQAGWNAEVSELAGEIDKTTAIEVAFGMASKRSIQDGIDRLVKRGVGFIVAVPLFVSSHSSVITSTQYLLGLRPEAPPELAIYARMQHGNGSHSDSTRDDGSFDPATPVKSPVPLRMTPAIDAHPVAAQILLSRAHEISTNPGLETVVVVAHGPVSDQENARWLADMGSLVGQMRRAGAFRRIEYLTVRDDAPEPIRSNAAVELRAIVERGNRQGDKVLMVPLLISYGGIEKGIQKRLEGLKYTMATRGLLPDERLVQWVNLVARESIAPAPNSSNSK